MNELGQDLADKIIESAKGKRALQAVFVNDSYTKFRIVNASSVGKKGMKDRQFLMLLNPHDSSARNVIERIHDRFFMNRVEKRELPAMAGMNKLEQQFLLGGLVCR